MFIILIYVFLHTFQTYMCLINHISDEAQTTKGGEGGKGVSGRWGEGEGRFC
jgi:hypothetical protein